MGKTVKRLILSCLVFAAAVATRVCLANQDATVVLSEEADTATLANGVVSVTVKKANGNLLSLRLRGVELLSRGEGYWNIYGNIPGQKNTEAKPTPSVFRVSQNPAQNGGALGEIALLFHYSGQSNVVPLDIEIRYALHRGDSGLYAWTIVDHASEYPPFDIAASTVCLKLNSKIVDFLSVDSRRQRLMATPEDWVQGTQLNLREARRLNSGIHKGEVEHKYDYNVLLSRTPAWGWSSTTRHVGIFLVNPSIEYLNGGPAMVDYVGHLDGKPSLPADPTLLLIWHSPHYGGRPIQIKSGESWRKIVGPFLLYCTAGKNPEVMWKYALARAAREQNAWPYAWAEAPGYEHASQRGSASGRIAVRDPQAPGANAAGAWVGLTHARYPARFAARGAITIDWQTDGKHYQYWTRADATGQFTIRNARPGIYTLCAFTDGVLGDFSRAGVRVEAGKTTKLGPLTWTPTRYGRQVWDIGIPNRSAEEFRHGDHYWQWGLYNLYPQEFPRDVDFVVGKSDWRHDWNYVQPPRPDGNGRWKNTTWRIRFAMDRAGHGTATLRLAICGARGGPVDIAINGQSIGTTGELPESGVMHRDGIRSDALTERNVQFDAALLKAGENVVELTKHVRTWTDGVLYDYLRLELDPGKAYVP
jgi:rhamnogalacturonan endolyase